MAWLLRQGDVLASVDMPGSRMERIRAMAGRRPGDEGAILVHSARFAHTLGAPFPVDVAFLDADLVVLATCSMARNRVGRPRVHARSVLEVGAGAFDRWDLRPGDRLEIKD